MEVLLVLVVGALIVAGGVLIFKKLKENGSIDDVKDAAKDVKDKVVDLIKKD